MSSGVQVVEEVTCKVNEIKLGKDNAERIRLLEFGFMDECGKTVLGVKKTITQADLSGTDAYCYMKDHFFKDDECHYLLYDCQYETSECGCKKELIFLMWSPDNGPIKQRMTYASSLSALKHKMQGIKHCFEVHDLSEVGTKKCFAEVLGRCDVLSLEGESL